MTSYASPAAIPMAAWHPYQPTAQPQLSELPPQHQHSPASLNTVQSAMRTQPLGSQD